MKFLALLSLTAILSSAFAAEEYGGITFYSNVEKNQVDAMKTDLNYLFNTPVSKIDEEFLKIAELPVGDGKNMHNWLINRVGHVVGESFVLNDDTLAIGIVQTIFFKFPDTPIPPIYLDLSGQGEEGDKPEAGNEPQAGAEALVNNEPQKDNNPPVENESEPESQIKTVMSNLGAGVYMMGKLSKVVLGIKVDDEKIYAMSPRVGILQVGEGLFDENFMLNKDVKAPVNSVSRLGTLFHEARHSDGTGISTSFAHDLCPKNHPYADNYACEVSGNGPYTIGGLAERHLIANCTSCSNEEVFGMIMRVADSFSRVLDDNLMKKRGALEQQLAMLELIIEAYKEELEKADEAVKPQMKAEIKELAAEYNAILNDYLKMMVNPESRPAFRDATPEGKVKTISLKDSSKKMEKSIKKSRKK